MLKHLLSLAAVAAISLSANADNLDILGSFGGSGWDSSYDADSKTITYDGTWKGRGWWLDGADYSDYETLVIEFANPLEDGMTLQVEYNNVDNETEVASAGDSKIEYTLNAEGKSSVKQIYLQYHGTGTVVLKAAYLVEPVAEGAFKTVELNLSNEGKNLLLSEYESYDDSYELDVFLSISNANSSVAAGWGVGEILRISDYDAKVYSFSAKAVSEEGAENKYKFTVGDFKGFAKLDTGEYWVDSWNQSGLSFNLYNGASLKSIQVQVPAETAVSSIAVDNENAPVEYFNLQGVRVANPQNGLYIKRQGNKATKVLVK